MSDSHPHTHSHLGAKHKKRLTVVLLMVVVFMVVEFVAGLLTGSLALISDAGHMATDALGVGMALAAIVAAGRATLTDSRTFGLYRLEILAAAANALLLFGVAGYVLFEAFRRLNDPPEVMAGPMLVVGLMGLTVNIVSWALLREGAKESLNVEGAFLEVMADLISSVGVVVAAVVITLTDWHYADALVAGGIGIFIIPRAFRLGRKAVRVLIQAAPDEVDLDDMRNQLAALSGVEGVHDLHVWTLTSGMPVATAHIRTGESVDHDRVLSDARSVVAERFGVAHATLQVESSDSECTELTW